MPILIVITWFLMAINAGATVALVQVQNAGDVNCVRMDAGPSYQELARLASPEGCPNDNVPGLAEQNTAKLVALLNRNPRR